jgi:ubiquinone/menaquinone biosynthesis C-methylase UbiE
MNKTTNKTVTKNSKKADQYNDPTFNYLHYWEGRDYENAAEVIAIQRFLKGKHFKQAIDIGGGYGRLSVLLSEYADKVTLAEPSQQQLDIAKDFLKDYPQIDRKLMQADKLQAKDGSVDLIMMIRVMHHLPDPSAAFNEVARALTDDGYYLLEIANYSHAQNRVKHALRMQKMPTQPIDIRSPENRKDGVIAFVNHNPKTVIKQLAHAGLKVEKTLSVSNLRSPGLKKVVPQSLMLNLEKVMQPTLART